MDMSIMNILIVKDDIEINNLISEALKKENYNIVQVYNGKEAVEKYNKKLAESVDGIISVESIPYERTSFILRLRNM